MTAEHDQPDTGEAPSNDGAELVVDGLRTALGAAMDVAVEYDEDGNVIITLGDSDKSKPEDQ